MPNIQVMLVKEFTKIQWKALPLLQHECICCFCP
jgi:hypothetical protein